jgi:hypothetical protein
MESPAKLTEDQFDIAIAFDGTWLHQGAAMTRMPLVRLFATVLQRDAAGDYWLITPVERGRIVVADAPFIAVGWHIDGGTLFLTDNLGREAAVDAAHPLTLRMPRTGGPFIPYHQLGGGVEARLATAVYYDLVDRALAAGGVDAAGRLEMESGGIMHPLGMAA